MLLDQNDKLLPSSPQEDIHWAIHMIVRLALCDGALPAGVIEQLASLRPDAGLRVANIMVMLAGAAVEDPSAWAGLLIEHLDGARKALRERALKDVVPGLVAH